MKSKSRAQNRGEKLEKVGKKDENSSKITHRKPTTNNPFQIFLQRISCTKYKTIIKPKIIFFKRVVRKYLGYEELVLKKP